MKKYLHNQSFVLESGAILPSLEVAYHSYGHLNAEGSNVIWVFHALTASSDVADWWSGLFGDQKLLDPTKYFIVCANVLGSCYGTTGPESIDPKTGQIYGPHFPMFTIRDIVQAHQILAAHLQIQHIHIGIGGSMGGQQLLQWAVIEPWRFGHLVCLATNAQHSPWGIAFNEAQRMALLADSSYYQPNEGAGKTGLKAARAVALMSYRHYDAFAEKQSEDSSEVPQAYRAATYQQYQGQKLAQRFSAYSYLRLSQAMDSHHIGYGFENTSEALYTLTMPVLILGIDSDILFPFSEQLFLSQHLKNGQLEIIQSNYGHDGFLVETEQLQQCISFFMYNHKKITRPNEHSATTYTL
jgi:homoserine O-acetyltransferase/O-succinyltransferase